MPLNFNQSPLFRSDKQITFQLETSWMVFTGPPRAGKSTTLSALESMGYFCKKEVARRYFKNRPRQSDWSEAKEAASQIEITEEKLRLERTLNPLDTVFLDRGMPDSITYYRNCGLDPHKAIPHSTIFKYNKVFLFESLPHVEYNPVEDNVRNENEELSIFISNWLEKDYASLGYEVIRVPVDSIEKRVQYILSIFGS